MSTFWDITQREMLYKGISQSAVGKHLNINRSTVNQWIKRDCLPPADYALQIADLLGVDLRYLITGVQEDTEALRVLLSKPELRRV